MSYTPQQQQYPNLNPYADTNGSSLENAKNSVLNNAQSTMDNIKNSQTVQSITNGPMADAARNEVDNTKSEFGNLAASRQTPSTTTANGQNLTHYHSFFYSLLSWENPRATAISYATIAILILVGRYVPLSRYALKAVYTALGVTAALEIVGKLALGDGLTAKIRPKKYYTIPHETLEQVLGDAEELINFFVIEFQRILFAENVMVTAAAFVTAFISYFLVKLMPSWGLALFFTTVVYFAPLVYISNQEFIDHHINNAQTVLTEQGKQVRDLAAQHTNKAVESSQSLLKDYSAKAQEMIGQTKKAAVDKGYVASSTAEKVAPEQAVKSKDFPSAPKVEPAGPETAQAEEHKAEPIVA